MNFLFKATFKIDFHVLFFIDYKGSQSLFVESVEEVGLNRKLINKCKYEKKQYLVLV